MAIQMVEWLSYWIWSTNMSIYNWL
jgi:hypothetical protein